MVSFLQRVIVIEDLDDYQNGVKFGFFFVHVRTRVLDSLDSCNKNLIFDVW